MHFKTPYEHIGVRGTNFVRGGGGWGIFPEYFPRCASAENSLTGGGGGGRLVHPSPTAPPPPSLGAYASEGVIMRFLVCILIIFLWCSGSCSRPVTRGSMVRIPLVVYDLRQCIFSTFVSLDPGVVIWVGIIPSNALCACQRGSSTRASMGNNAAQYILQSIAALYDQTIFFFKDLKNQLWKKVTQVQQCVLSLHARSFNFKFH